MPMSADWPAAARASTTAAAYALMSPPRSCDNVGDMSTSAVSSPVFIGRQREMAVLGRLLEGASARGTGFALIGGEAGVGKTRLTRELAERASAAGFLVLTGQCVELGA